MIELNNERIGQILHEETVKTEDPVTILRSIYTRYMRLYEKYFSDIDALNDDVIAELRNYHAETESLIKYYYMDIPQDICMGINEFEKKYSSKLLGPEWHECLFGYYQDFREKRRDHNSEEYFKEEFSKQVMEAFYNVMDYIFRDGFGTESQTAKNTLNTITGLLFGK